MLFFFCYEKQTTGNWTPVLYHNHPPAIKEGRLLTSNGLLNEVTTPVEIKEDFEPSISMLAKQFPREEPKMVRPVEGFQTTTGKFFEDEIDAIRSETAYALTTAFQEAAKQYPMLQDLDGTLKDEIVLQGLKFMLANKSEIMRYLNTFKDEDAPKPEMEDEKEDGELP